MTVVREVTPRVAGGRCGTAAAMRFLFLKHSLNWPRVRGHDVHTCFLMRALERMGHELNLFTVERPAAAAILGLRSGSTVSSDVTPHRTSVKLAWLHERFRSYWGVTCDDLNAFATIAGEWRPDVIVAAGPEALLYLAASPRGARRIWYAADDLCWQHLTQVTSLNREALTNLKVAAVSALYERAFARWFDGAWLVSEVDARAMHLIGGVRNVELVPNGVDTDYFVAGRQAEQRDSAVFWGNLSFEPNVRAIEWFCTRVWPIVRGRRPSATLAIVGHDPGASVRALSGRDGIAVMGPLEDLRPVVTQHAVAVMPFRSGSGLKNKMLEAAAMARATVCSRAALNGLQGNVEEAFVVASSPEEWAAAIEQLWDHDRDRAALGRRARQWVESHHTWERAAERAVASVARPARCR